MTIHISYNQNMQALETLPKAVDHRGAIADTATLLREAFERPDSPTKLVWLLEHQYSQAGLAFAGLKGSDAARAQVLLQAAEEADCAAHLAMVHIRETGSAELNYQSDWKSWQIWTATMSRFAYKAIDFSLQGLALRLSLVLMLCPLNPITLKPVLKDD